MTDLSNRTAATAPDSDAVNSNSPTDGDTGGWTVRSVYTLGFLTVIYAFNNVDRNVFGLLMPLMQQDLGLSDTMLGLASGFAFACFYALAGLPMAYLAERFSRRNIIGICFILWSLMTVATGMVRNSVELLAARFLLGAGEAGGTAPSTSMVGDMFDKRRRTLALSVLLCANSLGIMLAFPVLGWVAEEHGWRNAYLAAGVPGIVLGALFLLTVKEPVRGQADGIAKGANVPAPQSFVTVLKQLLASRAYVRAAIASTLLWVTISAMQAWAPTFLMRIHRLDSAEVGLYIGALRGPAGIAGALFGGVATTWLAKHDSRWLVWAPALFLFCVALANGLLLFAGGIGWKVGMVLDTFFTGAQVGPMFALLLAGANARTRATATALSFVIIYLVGMTSGPILVGALNDLLAPTMGDGAIRWSLLAAASASVLAGLVCLSIGRLDEPEASRSET